MERRKCEVVTSDSRTESLLGSVGGGLLRAPAASRCDCELQVNGQPHCMIFLPSI